MTAMLISDTHGACDEKLRALSRTLTSGDYLIHCGDGAGDLGKIDIPSSCKAVAVRGNCDFLPALPAFRILDLPSARVLVTHGHEQNVSPDALLGLYYFAAEQNCTYVVYGHTHVADITIYGGVTFVNPGSLARPRGGKPSYAVITEENGQPSAKIVYI